MKAVGWFQKWWKSWTALGCSETTMRKTPCPCWVGKGRPTPGELGPGGPTQRDLQPQGDRGNHRGFSLRSPPVSHTASGPPIRAGGQLDTRAEKARLLALGASSQGWPPWSLPASSDCPGRGRLTAPASILLLLLLFSHSVVSDALWPHGLQYARPPCPSPTPRACSNSCPSSWWCHPTISSSVIPFSFCLQSFPASGSFQMGQLFTSDDKHWSFSFSISPSNEYSGLISLKVDWFDLFVVQGTLRSLLQHHSSKASILHSSAFFTVQLSKPCVTIGKTTA